MVVAAGVHIFKFGRFMVTPLGVGTLEQKTFNFVGGIERVSFLFVQIVGIAFQQSANVRRIRRAILVDHLSKNENLSGAKHIRGGPIKRAPVHRQPQITFALRRKAADRRAVKRQVVPALDQELLVVIEHVQAALEVAEQHGNCFDALLVAQILDALLLYFVRCNTIQALLLGL